MINFGINVSHVTIESWSNKFTTFFKQKTDKTVVFINSKRYYLWLTIDSEIRFILTSHLIKSRNSASAYTLINEAKKYCGLTYFITDRLPSYNQAAATVLPNNKYVSVSPMSSDRTNNL